MKLFCASRGITASSFMSLRNNYMSTLVQSPVRCNERNSSSLQRERHNYGHERRSGNKRQSPAYHDVVIVVESSRCGERAHSISTACF